MTAGCAGAGGTDDAGGTDATGGVDVASVDVAGCADAAGGVDAAGFADGTGRADDGGLVASEMVADGSGDPDAIPGIASIVEPVANAARSALGIAMSEALAEDLLDGIASFDAVTWATTAKAASSTSAAAPMANPRNRGERFGMAGDSDMRGRAVLTPTLNSDSLWDV